MSEKDFVDLLNEEMKELIENLPQVKQLKAEIERLKEDNKRLNGLLVSGTESLDYWTNKYLEEQAKNTELESELATANLQLQFQMGEVDLRDKEIESLSGKRKPEDNEVLNILDKLSEIAYKEGCAKDVLKVIDYINWQRIQIEWLLEAKNVSDDRVEKALQGIDKICYEKDCSDKINLVRNFINSLRRENEKLKEQLNEDRLEVEYSPFLMCENYDLYLRSMSREELIEYFYFVTDNYRKLSEKAALENIELEKQINQKVSEIEKLNNEKNDLLFDIKDRVVSAEQETVRLNEEKENLYFENQNLQTYIDNHEAIWKRNSEQTIKELLKEIVAYSNKKVELVGDCDETEHVVFYTISDYKLNEILNKFQIGSVK